MSEEQLSDSRLRSVLKGLTWRCVATLTTILIAWLIFGDVRRALQVGGIEFFTKFFVYYLHERAWARVPLGTVRKMASKRGE